ncbi:MAG: (E)-4-hydroxy-3-methylbut-2-enyl-diphosphate synthase [Duncaniella sp.]|nr:(E)-4-hydroxy-3-methylbut-2-enyl-diphosphate synthase [Duncaniella sp.]
MKRNLNYRRRPTSEVKIGNVKVGGDAPVILQSMTSTSTMDTPGSVAQIERIADAGGEMVRLTAQGEREAVNLTEIRDRVREEGYDTPLVADIHFSPKAAFAAAERVEKVRINPGNFVDPGRVFRKIEFTDEEYAAEIGKIERGLLPLLEICRAHGTALRIGVNHGSLSDRIMSRYGDTPAGMVESAMEFLRVCVAHDFKDVVISIKASNVRVMTETVRRLVKAMDAEDMHFPLHLGVTEAGDGEDGRVKSAVGIGSLLVDGIGDTIRVSLSEAPEAEIPVARAITDHVVSISNHLPQAEEVEVAETFDDADPAPRRGRFSPKVPVVVGLDLQPDAGWIDLTVENFDDRINEILAAPERYVVANLSAVAPVTEGKVILHRLAEAGAENPVILHRDYSDTPTDTTITAAIEMGSLLLSGYSDGLWIEDKKMTKEQLESLALNVLQATRQRISKTEYISCPGCGRTLYDLQTAIARIKEATGHLTGLKIGIMGCIVNGPGEMADADYGYVGAGVGNVSLYKGKQCMVKNIPTEEALPRLIQLIKDNGDWKDPE